MFRIRTCGMWRTSSHVRYMRDKSAERQGDLHPQLVVAAAEVDLARRPRRLAPVLLRPRVHGLIRAEDLGERTLVAADLGEGDLTAGKPVLAVPLRHADLDGSVLLVVDGTVVEHERRAAFTTFAQVLERLADERLELRDADAP